MKTKKAFISVVMILMITVALIPVQRAHASSVTASFTKVAPDGDIRVDDMLKLELTMNADVEIGAVELYIAYDSDVFEYITGPDCVLGGEGILRISDPGTSTFSKKRNYLMYFQAVSMGESNFRIRNNPEIYDADEGNAMSVSSQPLKLTVLAGTTASSDATLASLKVGSAVLTPSFDPDIRDYNVRVENSVLKLAVSAIANDPMASVAVEGADELKVGSNRITVLVTAPDGTENKYVVYCVRDEAPPEEQKEEPEKEEKETPAEKKEAVEKSGHEQAFYVTKQDEKIMLIADTQYEMMETSSGISIPEGYYKTSILISGYTVTAFSPVPEGTPEYLLLILRKEGNDPGLYVYDRMEKTLQRYGLTDTEKDVRTEEKDSSGQEEIPDKAAYEKTVNTLTTVIAVLSGVCMLLLIMIIRIVFRRRGSSRTGRERKTSEKRGRSRK